MDNFSPIGKVTHAVASNLKGKNARWWETPESIEAKGKELGIEAHKGETMAAYKDRLFKAIQHAERSQA